MGWSFRQLNVKPPPVDSEMLAVKHRDLLRTAFDDQVALPQDFIAPRSTIASRKKSKAKTCVDETSRVYSRHDTGLTATRAAAHSPSSSSKKHPTVGRNDPVDFVYDLNVRRKLREQIENERTSVRQEVKAKQTRLKAANLWLNECSQPLGDQCVRKQVWAQPSSKRHMAKTHPGPAVSTPLSTSANAGRPPAATKTRKSSFAPNVSMWRAQASSAKHSASTRQQKQQQQREAKEVETMLDAFDERLASWSI